MRLNQGIFRIAVYTLLFGIIFIGKFMLFDEIFYHGCVNPHGSQNRFRTVF